MSSSDIISSFFLDTSPIVQLLQFIHNNLIFDILAVIIFWIFVEPEDKPNDMAMYNMNAAS